MAALSKVAQPSLVDSLKALMATRKGKISGLVIIAIILGILKMKRDQKNTNKDAILGASVKPKKRSKGNIDAVFVYRVMQLIKICVPSLSEPVLLDFVILNGALFMRTVLSNTSSNLRYCNLHPEWTYCEVNHLGQVGALPAQNHYPRPLLLPCFFYEQFPRIPE